MACFLFMDPTDQYMEDTDTGNKEVDKVTNDLKNKYYKFMWEDALKNG